MNKKFLIIKVGAIGDAVMALPMLKTLREKHPKAHITWMGGKVIQELIEHFKYIDIYISLDEKELYHPSPFKKIKCLLSVWKKNVCRKYDTVFILHNDTRYRVLSWFCCKKQIKLCTHGKYLKLDQYHAFGYRKLVSEETYPVTNPIVYPKIDFSNFKHPTIQQPMILLCPGGAKNIHQEQSLRRWPILHYVKLAKLCIKNNLNVGLIGSDTDLWTLPYFEGLNIHNYIQNRSLIELCYWIQQSSLFVTHDTGPMHLAKLTQTPTLALFGPVSPHARSSQSTYENNIHVLWGGESLACRPCYDGKNFPPCHNALCMSRILPESVFEKIEEILEKATNEF